MIFNKVNKSKIKFFCDPECQDVIPEPYPARKLMPDWYKKLPNFAESPDENFDFKTIGEHLNFSQAFCEKLETKVK